MHHAIAAIHGVALAGDEDVFTLREKDFLALAGVISKSEELQIDGLFVERTSLDGGICLAGVVSRAAELLGVSRPTLYDLVSKYGIQIEVAQRE